MALAVGARRQAGLAMKQTAERTGTFEPHFKADVCHSLIGTSEQKPGALKASLREIGMRALPEYLLEGAHEMVGRELSNDRNIGDSECIA